MDIKTEIEKLINNIEITGETRESLKIKYKDKIYNFADIRRQKGNNLLKKIENFVNHIQTSIILPDPKTKKRIYKKRKTKET